MAILTSSTNARAEPELLAFERIFSVNFTTRYPEVIWPPSSMSMLSFGYAEKLSKCAAAGWQHRPWPCGKLGSLRLDRSSSGLFSTDVPKMIEGPAITWTTLVL
jgi:hypothetical protein